jgi:phosphoserine aminotransferase
MLCNEDFLDTLAWGRSIGGLPELIRRSQQNLALFEQFTAQHPWIHFLATDPATRSNTSVCFTLDLTPDQVKKLVKILSEEKAALDCGAYRDAPPGLRFWCGATVEAADIERMLPWLEWAYEQVK